MNLICKTNSNWQPFSLLEEMDRLFAPAARRSESRPSFVPEIDFQEDEHRYVLKADLPGIKRDNLDISITGNVLSIRGERKEETEKKEKGYYHSERWTGSFERTFEFPADIEGASVKAVFQDGVLELTVPKAESAKPKQIRVDVK